MLTVEKKDLVATYSTHSSVESVSNFIVETSKQGSFVPKVPVGSIVKKGDVLALNSDVQLVSPVDAKVVKISDASTDLPSRFPVVELRYEGFSLAFQDESASGLGEASGVQGSFQIQNGLGPSECGALVLAQNSEGNGSESGAISENGNSISNPGGFLCLIDKSVPVRTGQQATLVLHGVKRNNVLAVPISAVAGRAFKGKVTLISTGKAEAVEVGLGVNDGAFIEITSGLKEGEKISAIAPNLDPRE
ncbi:hypothetical protein [Boudabousia liubingyangii]|uniref:hypothetical protein n=1 Tax=Boudabousia liubingyangii TaxID=1921764 RepID=UPI000F788DD6|nr:hypothetical protein [Boudabousia liubingyangii]